MHSKKSFLFGSNNIWQKKNSNFDVTMGSYDGAETCELVGLYMLSQLQDLEINVGLYRDDGLAVCDKTPQETERIKKKICKIFSENKLKLTVDANKKTIDYLDVTLDLNTGMHKPYTKPNNKLLYVHNQSNHPPSILKNIPKSINKRLSKISSNEIIFTQAKPQYQEALRRSGYKQDLKFENTNNTPTRNDKNRKRKIIWYNPPYSDTVQTNIGKKFLNLVNKSFPKGSKLHKIFNKNTIKLSYSCMANMQQIVSSHNSRILRNTLNPSNNNANSNTNKDCNCRRQACPLDGKCLSKSLIYQATVKRADNDEESTYIGLTEGTFKNRFTNHKHSFNNIGLRNATALSKYIWKLKDRGINHTITWKMITQANTYSTKTKLCNLCLTEIFFIICKPTMSSLNYRNELASFCRHRKKKLLSSIT